MNKEQSAWVEINKSIAEKQTIYVGQKAAINGNIIFILYFKLFIIICIISSI